ncbi:MAG TPA: zf-HC2 domain-containing protein [Elusimicrobiota bacterium]|nr:zf-HC2 domain-containing protein [Elusimicrobiota bacterium]
MNHPWSEEQLMEYRDGELAAELRRSLEAHVGMCVSCRGRLAQWDGDSRLALAPLRMAASEAFVQDVMRKVRLASSAAPSVQGDGLFLRWALPTLALSMAGFAGALVYTVQPVMPTTQTLLAGESTSNSMADWMSNPTSDEQVLDTAASQ